MISSRLFTMGHYFVVGGQSKWGTVQANLVFVCTLTKSAFAIGYHSVIPSNNFAKVSVTLSRSKCHQTQESPPN